MDYLNLIEDSVDRWNQWRLEHPQMMPDLSGANLSQNYLFEANLSGTNLSGANLSRACLIGADLSRANLTGADLHGAYMDKANLLYANLKQARLTGASLRESNLSYADLFETEVSEADLEMANLSGTCLVVNISATQQISSAPADAANQEFAIRESIIRESAIKQAMIEKINRLSPARKHHAFQAGLLYLTKPTPSQCSIPKFSPSFSDRFSQPSEPRNELKS